MHKVVYFQPSSLKYLSAVCYYKSTMTSLITTLILLLVVIVMVDGSSIKSCCDVAVKHYFTANKSPSGVYNIIDFCQQGTTVQGYCDTLTDGGGWLVV